MSSTLAPPLATGSGYRPRYIDIGINLADPIFRGQYYGKQRHPDDLADVVKRAGEVGCSKLIVTGSDLTSSRDALKLAEQFPGVVYTTAGIHPCSSAIFEVPKQDSKTSQTGLGDGDGEGTAGGHTPACDPDPTKPQAEDGELDVARTDQILADLEAIITTAAQDAHRHQGPAAIGEIGLDYDRLHYCSASTQRHAFAAQLALAARLTMRLPRPLPLFLHSRACHADFVALLQAQFGSQLERLTGGGVVHSFTGTLAEAEELMHLGLYLGVNGCSLKTAENCDVVRAIRLDRLMLETDGPWCEVRPSHEGWAYLVKAAEEANKAAAAAAAAVKATETATTVAAVKATETATTVAATETPQEANKTVPQGKRRGKGNNAKPPKEPPLVPELFKTVKKEKWEAGAMVKGRNEPCMIVRVAAIVAAIKGVSVEEVCEASWANTVKLFNLREE